MLQQFVALIYDHRGKLAPGVAAQHHGVRIVELLRIRHRQDSAAASP
jgi:hypothetical protein